MKKLLTIFIMIAFVGITESTAQNGNNRRICYNWEEMDFRYGIRGGINAARLHVDGVRSEEERVGMNIGIYYQSPITNLGVVAFQPELWVTTRGAKDEYDLGDFEGTTEFNLTYIDVPLLFAFKFSPRLEMYAGPYFSYLVDANLEFETENQPDRFRNLDNRDINNFDYGLVGGLGFFVGQHFEVGARYNFGLADMTDDGATRELLLNANNSWASLYIGWSWVTLK